MEAASAARVLLLCLVGFGVVAGSPSSDDEPPHPRPDYHLVNCPPSHTNRASTSSAAPLSSNNAAGESSACCRVRSGTKCFVAILLCVCAGFAGYLGPIASENSRSCKGIIGSGYEEYHMNQNHFQPWDWDLTKRTADGFQHVASVDGDFLRHYTIHNDNPQIPNFHIDSKFSAGNYVAGKHEFTMREEGQAKDFGRVTDNSFTFWSKSGRFRIFNGEGDADDVTGKTKTFFGMPWFKVGYKFKNLGVVRQVKQYFDQWPHNRVFKLCVVETDRKDGEFQGHARDIAVAAALMADERLDGSEKGKKYFYFF